MERPVETATHARTAMLVSLRAASLVVALVAVTALRSPTYEGASSVATGTWGGTDIRLEVTDRGAQADFGCAHGSIDEPMTLDSDGRFDAKGTYAPEGHGPQREDQSGQGRPARYAGRVQGSTMTVTISLIESGETVGPFTLTHGKTPKITKCL